MKELKKKMLADAERRAEHGVENANPADDEPIIDRIDTSKGFVPGNIRIISGRAYKMRHHPRPLSRQ